MNFHLCGSASVGCAVCVLTRKQKMKEQQGMLSAGRTHLVACWLAWTQERSIKAAYDCT